MAQQYLDFINIMTYDFAGSWSATTGHHTNLYLSAADGAPEHANTGVDEHIRAGIPARKIVLGVTPAQNGLYQPYGASVGSYAYQTLVAEYINQNGFRRYWDDAAKAPYLWHADSSRFITYDDEESLRHKADFVKAKGLGGVMYWEHSHDPDEVLLGVLFQHLR